MDELVRQAAAIARGMWKYRWHGMVAAWVAAIIGAGVLWRLPDKYEASARIYVDTQSILKPLMSGLTVQPNVDQQVTMLSRTLISRPNVEKLVRMADLDLKTTNRADQEALIERLMNTLKIQSTLRDNLYTLSYVDTDPEKAKRVIQSLVSIFVESSLGSSRKDTDTAKTFINEQIEAYRVKLEEAEARLKEFKLRTLEFQNSEGKDATTRLSELSEQLQQARVELREAEQGREAAKAALEAEKGGGATGGLPNLLQGASAGASVATPEFDARIAEQSKQLDALLQRYTEQHPDVQNARRVLKDLEAQKQAKVKELQKQAAAAPSGGGGDDRRNNLAYQELTRMLAAADIQVASLRARVGEYSARYNHAREQLRAAPQIEAEAAQLNRDYGIHKKNYEDLVARRESAAISGRLEGASGVADFRLIDPPRASNKPVAPNRTMLLPLVLLAALAVGAAFAFGLSRLRPVFSGTAELRQRLGLPVLGVVTLMMTAEDRRRQRLGVIQFWSAAGSLVMLFVAGFAVMLWINRARL